MMPLVSRESETVTLRLSSSLTLSWMTSGTFTDEAIVRGARFSLLAPLLSSVRRSVDSPLLSPIPRPADTKAFGSVLGHKLPLGSGN